MNPTWDVAKHSSHLLMKVKPRDTQLVLEIKNKNALVPDELIGRATLDLAAVTDESDAASPLQLPVKPRPTYSALSYFLCSFGRRSSFWCLAAW